MSITLRSTISPPEFPSWLIRPPGVYKPQHDTWLLADAMRDLPVTGARVLDFCTGTGALAVAAAAAGAATVHAVDVSRRAVVAAWANARVRGLAMRISRGGLEKVASNGPFDLILANPPYVPCGAESQLPHRAWDAGPDGRAVVDPLCAVAPELLADGGSLLMVHSDVCDVDRTLDRLREGGLRPAVVRRRTTGFGPVMRARVGLLESSGLIRVGQRYEELVVIRAERAE